MQKTIFGSPNILLIYMSKLSPLFIVAFVVKMIGYFAEEKGNMGEKNEEDDLRNTFNQGDERVAMNSQEGPSFLSKSSRIFIQT